MALIILNLFLKSYNIHGNSLHLDEVFRIYWSQRSYSDILEISKKETNPPLYLWILHTWYILGSGNISEVYARYLSLIFSVLTPIVIFYFGRSYFNDTAGKIAAVLFSFNPIQIKYAHNVSVYTIVTFLFVCSLYISYLFFRDFNDKFKRWIIFCTLIIVNTALVYAHYFIIFGLIAEFFIALLYVRKNLNSFILYVASQVISAVLFLPWLPIMLSNSKATSWMSEFTWLGLYYMLNTLLGTGSSSYISILCVSLTIILIINLLHIKKNQMNISRTIIILMVIFLPIIGVSVVSTFLHGFFVDRYMMYFLPGVFLLIGYQISIIEVHSLIKLLICGFILKTTTFTLDLNPIHDAQVRNVATLIKNEISYPNTMLVVSAGYQFANLLYYCDRYLFSNLSPTSIPKEYEKNTINIVEPKDIHKLDTMDWNKIVYVEIHREYVDPTNYVMSYLKSTTYPYGNYSEPGINITMFTKKPILWPSLSENTVIYTSFETNDISYAQTTRKIAKFGNYSAYANNYNCPYSNGIYGKIGKLHGSKRRIKASAWLYLKESSTKANFCLSFHNSDGDQYFWKNAVIDYSKYNQWQQVSIQTEIPDTKSEDDELRCYLNVFEGGEAYIDDIKITVE